MKARPHNPAAFAIPLSLASRHAPPPPHPRRPARAARPAQPTRPAAGRARRATPRAGSAEVPTSFSLKWYNDSLAPTDLDIAAHYIAAGSNGPQLDFHHIDHEARCIALLDDPSPPTTDNDRRRGDQVLNFIRESIDHNRAAASFSAFPTLDLPHILAAAANRFQLPPAFSALLLDLSANFLRVASVGSCAVIVVRDDAIVYRSYPYSAASLIEHVPCSGATGKTGTTATTTTTTTEPAAVEATAASASATGPVIHSDFFELADNDLVLAGTDGLFANLTDDQVLAFVRPVPDKMDPTLAIANNTCLGSWTSDDVSFISYYLAFLANNFATALNCAPVVRYPFPPSPHLDDVTVVAASFSAGSG